VNIILCDTDEHVVRAWEQFCGDLDYISIRHGSILDCSAVALVSPANSFGFMDGGIDATYVSYFGSGIQKRVQRQILDHHAGELIVGAADMVETGSTAHPYLIIAPTMRVPMILRDSVNAYLAMRAVLLLVSQGRFRDGPHRGENIGEQVQIVAMPGLGTGIGTMGPNTCAHQMRVAVDDILLGRFQLPNSWAEASIRHQNLYTTNIRHLQQE